LKTFLLFLLMAVSTAAAGHSPQATEKPLDKNQITSLVSAGMDNQDLAKRVRELGINFDPTEDYLQALRKAGANDVLIQALRDARPKSNKPLTREQVLQLIAGGVPSERAASLVRQRGIDFAADDEYLETLRVAGADQPLVDAVREASKTVPGELVVQTSPFAEVFFDGESQGRADAQGQSTVKAKPGEHTLKVALAGKRDFQQAVTITPAQPVKVEARLQDLERGAGAVNMNSKDGLKYVWIPPGTFMMGCSPGDSYCEDDEKPSHQVTITKGFWLGQTPVTVGAYTLFSGASGHRMPPDLSFNSGWANEDMPIVNVAWNDAVAYCSYAGGRLPTEAEWEYAARAGSTESRYGPIDEIAWYSANSSLGTRDVAQKRPNGFGLYDTLGKVREWVNDWYDGSYYQSSPAQDPPGPSGGKYHVLRGGSGIVGPREVRVSDRLRGGPGVIYNYFGFRCVGDLGAP
jgi:formylglycine-generating enzyme required for sulfatase activity